MVLGSFSSNMLNESSPIDVDSLNSLAVAGKTLNSLNPDPTADVTEGFSSCASHGGMAVDRKESNLLTILGSFAVKTVMTYSINAGIYVLDPSLLAVVPNGNAMDMPDFVQICLERGEQIAGYQITEAWLDIGDLTELERARREAAFLL